MEDVKNMYKADAIRMNKEIKQLKTNYKESLKKMRETIDMFKNMAERSSRNNLENLKTNQQEIEKLRQANQDFKSRWCVEADFRSGELNTNMVNISVATKFIEEWLKEIEVIDDGRRNTKNN